jgi:hypothetical protein
MRDRCGHGDGDNHGGGAQHCETGHYGENKRWLTPVHRCISEETKDEFQEHHVGQDDDETCKNHGVGGSAARSLRAAPCENSLKTGNESR